jgi:hypothetical protein
LCADGSNKGKPAFPAMRFTVTVRCIAGDSLVLTVDQVAAVDDQRLAGHER